MALGQGQASSSPSSLRYAIDPWPRTQAASNNASFKKEGMAGIVPIDNFRREAALLFKSIRLEDIDWIGSLQSGTFGGHWFGTPVTLTCSHIQQPSFAGSESFLLASHLRLLHPNIQTVCGAAMDHFPQVIVSESLEGSLAEVIVAAHDVSYLTEYEQLSNAIEIVSAVCYLHQLDRPCTHCNIKPSNILVRSMTMKLRLESVHLLDRFLSEGPVSDPRYLAPERSSRADETCARSSMKSTVFSLGLTLIEMFTGYSPESYQDERQSLLQHIDSRNRHQLCSGMTDVNPACRLSAKVCLERLRVQLQ
eukprot:m.176875 g.176875  ORF g.176875 m.176875 type:complete len:307 (+) comp39148_c0_seq34:837-1757(+)